jgi:hypothetical protein
VTATVTDKVICVFHTSITFPRCKWLSRLSEIVECHTIKRPRKWINSIKIFASDLQKAIVSIFMVGNLPGPLYLPGNIQSG